MITFEIFTVFDANKNLDIMKKVSKYASIFTLEALAIIQALD